MEGKTKGVAQQAALRDDRTKQRATSAHIYIYIYVTIVAFLDTNSKSHYIIGFYLDATRCYLHAGANANYSFCSQDSMYGVLLARVGCLC